MKKNNVKFQVEESEKQSWGSISMIWIGAMISVSMLMLGGTLIGGMSFKDAIISGLIGYSIVAIIMCFQGIMGADLGLPTVSMATSALGEKGSRIITSISIGVACLGWFALQANVTGAAFSTMVESMGGPSIPVTVSSVVWGLIMLTTAVYGIKALKYLNYIAVPSLIITCIYGVYKSIALNGWSNIVNSQPAEPMSMLMAVSISVGSFALAAVIGADYTRYARSRQDVIKSSLLGVIPVGILMIMAGAIMAVSVGSADIGAVFISLGVPVIGIISLILATWTTNAVNAFSGGLAITNLFNLGEDKRKMATAVAGIIGTLLAVTGIMDYFVQFLTVLTTAIPPVGGVIIADYWIINKGKKENFTPKEGVNWNGVISFLGGSLAATFITVGIQPITGIITSMVMYVGIHYITAAVKNKEQIGENI